MESIAQAPVKSAAGIEELARELARAHRLSSRQPRRGAVRRYVASLAQRLDVHFAELGQESPAGRTASAEWLLDNQHVVRGALTQVQRDLSPGFLAALRTLEGNPLDVPTPVYAIAVTLVAEGHGRVDPERSRRFLEAYQSVSPLTMAELWAFPVMLRLALVSDLADTGDELVSGKKREPAEAVQTAPAPGDAGASLDERIAGAIGSLRAAGTLDWKAFFESVSRVERTLRRLDPAGAYSQMDFDTRDSYRKVVEELARGSGQSEGHVALQAVELARASRDARPPDESPAAVDVVPGGHVGFYLAGEGRTLLEPRLGYSPPLRHRAARWLRSHSAMLYFGAIASLSAGALLAIVGPLVVSGGRPWSAALLTLLSVVPSTTVAIAVVNWAVAQAVRPRTLAKLDFSRGIPETRPTVVVVPCLLTEEEEIRSLARRLELNYGGNADPVVRFVLLTDHTDAPRQVMAGDDALLRVAIDEIEALNRRYGGDGSGAFMILHRPRRWNPSENCWMGWERKRGKLWELNRLALGLGHGDFISPVGDIDDLKGTRYVVTLDADTFLPQGAAARLVGTLAHPLNTPGVDSSGRLVRGYSVLQPRIETLPGGDAPSRFSKVYEADQGLDLYSHAVSDVYQDLFRMGIYAGKGVYDVAAFQRTLAGRVPANALLSHDLFEGVHGRSALVSDIAVFEDFPTSVLAFIRRLHRWVRGDWQISPWLLSRVPAEGGDRIRNPISLLGRWQIADNLRRSLLMGSLSLLLVGSWLSAAVHWWWGTVAMGLVLGAPVFLGAATSARARFGRRGAFLSRSAPLGLFRWALGVVFLPYQAVMEIDGILRTLFRLCVSRKRLLEWTTASVTSTAMAGQRGLTFFAKQMASAPALAVGAGGLVALLVPERLVVVAPVLLGWLLSPVVALWVSAPLRPRRRAPRVTDARAHRELARRTWAYFERFLGPENHWLPPDNYQEDPGGRAAPRTSPTNIGLGLLSALAAYDLGYLTLPRFAATVSNILEGVERLETHRGHLLNWYDTRSLEPLAPRYVSTVDSGNLAASLVTLRIGCATMADDPLPRRVESDGLADTLRALCSAVERMPERGGQDVSGIVKDIGLRIGELIRGVEARRDRPHAAVPEVAGGLFAVERRIEDMVEAGAEGSGGGGVFPEIRDWLLRLHGQMEQVSGGVDALLPWISAFEGVAPSSNGEDDASTEVVWRALRSALPPTASLREIPDICGEALGLLQPLLDSSSTPDSGEGGTFAGELACRLRRASELATELLRTLDDLQGQSAQLAERMDFAFLYDDARYLFHIGYNATTGELDNSYYDLLASEARLASFLAIAKGDIRAEHWLHLGRPFGKAGGGAVLLSWAGTMFEYLMPRLFMRTPEHSLLAVSCRRAIERQIQFARGVGSPWGISESAYHDLDSHATYQYRAFGVPALALRRDTLQRLVVSPYASVLALPFTPAEVTANLETLERHGASGSYGLYEALDFGSPEGTRARRPRVVRSYMAHHQGMILVALDNLLNDDVMVARFHADPRTAAAEFLLYERAPGHVRTEPLAPQAPVPLRPITRPPAVESWSIPMDESPVQALVLSNGSLSSLVTATGAGGLRWGDRAITRWRPDLMADSWGHWLYVQDLSSGALWSATRAPTWSEGDVEVTFSPHQAEYHRLYDDLSVRVAVTIPPSADVEIRRVTLVNERARPRRLHITNFAEVSLAQQDEDRRHPAFVKLFVESEFHPELDVLLYRRRPASAQEPPHFMAHALSYRPGRGSIAAWETDRERFLGRNGDLRRPAALEPRERAGSGSAGSVLDPIASFTCEVDVPASGEIELVYLTAVGRSKAAVLEAIDTYRTPDTAAWAFQQSRSRSQRLLHSLGIKPAEVRRYQQLLTALLHPYHRLRGRASRFPDRMPQQQGLWALGISGDLPLLVVRVSRSEDTGLLLEAVKAYALWREQNMAIELAVVDESADGYHQPLGEWLRARLGRLGRGGDRNRPRGVHYLPASRLDPLHRAAVEESASVMLETDRGDLDAHLAWIEKLPRELPPFVPMPTGPWAPEPTEPLPPLEGVRFYNGFGGLTPDGREYRIRLDPGVSTPAPWINVVATPELGFIVSEAGSGFSWVGNSGESRLTTWSNDPVLDRSGEAIYVRDEETAEYWSPTPHPRPGEGAYEIRHGAGYSTFLHHGHGVRHRLEMFASADPRAKVVSLDLENDWSRDRRLTVTYFAEWVLGADRQRSAPHLDTEFDPRLEILLARDLFNELEEAGVAFLASDEAVHGWTMDRREFLGPGGDLRRPAGLERMGLGKRRGTGIDPCAALQVHVNLMPGESKTVRFFLGWAETAAEAKEIVHTCRGPGAVERMRECVGAFWETLLSRVSVRSPDAAMDALLNRWLLYQALSCRLWGRSALYQSSGAFGFRDQLQDALAFLHVRPEVAREQILEAASRQFGEGDVLHWWHPPSGRGVRTRCSDDLLWLPFVTAAYVQATGDVRILDEEVAYLAGAPLANGELERYGSYGHGDERGTLYEHCIRAVERGATKGSHGLPLIGTGDWNDALDRVGVEGLGESVWLAWFLYATLETFRGLVEARGDEPIAGRFREGAAELLARVEEFAWDGRWYVRATYDDGATIGSATNDEARIDAISQAWAVLSGGGRRQRVESAMGAVWEELVREEDGLVLLLTPPFDRTDRWPGYIKAYPPGVRENGGQYTHAALWTAWAFAALKDGDRAGRCFELLNPLSKSRDRESALRYRVEPYAVAADVYSVPPHVGRGGWTWYTGSASWMWRLGTEAILGLYPVPGGFAINPCIPSTWPGYEVEVRLNTATYRIRVENPEGVSSGVQRIHVDGTGLPSNRIDLVDDGQEHDVLVRLGAGAAASSSGGAGHAPRPGTGS